MRVCLFPPPPSLGVPAAAAAACAPSPTLSRFCQPARIPAPLPPFFCFVVRWGKRGEAFHAKDWGKGRCSSSSFFSPVAAQGQKKGESETKLFGLRRRRGRRNAQEMGSRREDAYFTIYLSPKRKKRLVFAGVKNWERCPPPLIPSLAFFLFGNPSVQLCPRILAEI